VVAGLTGGVVISHDGGSSWNSSWIEQTNAPINCFVASPNVDQDGALLAGLDGDGVLRSESHGRFWRLSNFGLRNFNINTLAVLPPWGLRQELLAGTAAGVYRSPNGGRAWKFSGLENRSVLALAVAVASSAPADPVVLAGVEAGGLFRSTDGGRLWSPAALGDSSAETVSALWSDGRQIFLAAGERGLWRSHDCGVSWRLLPGSPARVQSLAGLGTQGHFFAAVGRP